MPRKPDPIVVGQWTDGANWSMVNSPDSSTTRNHVLLGVSCSASYYLVAGYCCAGSGGSRDIDQTVVR